MSADGAFSISSKLHAIPWRAVRADAKGNIIMSATKDQFKQAAGFTNSYWPSQGDPRWLSASAGDLKFGRDEFQGGRLRHRGPDDANNSQARTTGGPSRRE